jgi:hypothetical protein
VLIHCAHTLCSYPDAHECREAWGDDCKQLVSACFLAVITAALPSIRGDLVLARWCVYAIDTLQEDIAARKDDDDDNGMHYART